MKENKEQFETDQRAVSTEVKSRKKDVIVYTSNPFWGVTQVKIGTKRVTMSGGYVAKQDTGETISMAGIHRIETVDEDRFLKLFTQNSALFFDLSRPGQKLLHCVLTIYQATPGKDGIWMTWRDCEDWIKKNEVKGLSRPSYHRALAELLHKKLIAESDRTNHYWINPHVFFNGDRLVYIQEYRKAKPKQKGPEVDPRQLPLIEPAALENE